MKQASRPSPGAAWRKRIAVASRWLHIYLSMISFGVILFFAVTGLTLNHADKLSGMQRVARYTGTIAATAMQPQPDHAAIEAQLRREHHIRGAVTDTRDDPDQVTLSFKGAGYAADAFIDRPGGKYQIIETRSGAIATLNDLHRGAVTGRAWSRIIDASAVFLTLVSLTGLCLLLFVYKRRSSGLILAAIGIAVAVLIARFLAA
ncbi:PepSY-associated TM helix domain-containing protein [Terriglobus aquaticus]|uniref:PepSY-associated TM helix domain-containing protein n=1 Tax=Terriglobus aquaticus TaxID=940139 RepID=A0ABW9KIR7_9BACT|nr:PepSY-associated TM helix domain-containing protein [Terriglobus aquaticus]